LCFRKDIANKPDIMTSKIELKAENSKPKSEVRGKLISIILKRKIISTETKYLLSLRNNILY